MGLLTLLPILGFALFIERRWRVPSAVALLHAVALLIVALYCGALVGALWWIALAIHGVGVGALGHEALQRTKAAGPISVPVPYIALIVLCGLFWLIHANSQYFLYDEFAHWGIFLKDMLALDAFWPAGTNAMHARYLPGSTLWQYLFNAFQEPTDGKAYLGQFVLLIVPLLVLWSGLSWRQLPWILGIAALCALLLTNFGLGVSSLYVDGLLGAWFAGTLLCYLSEPDMSWRRTLPYAAALIVLTLLKDVGLAFALAAAAMMAALILRRVWVQRRDTRACLSAAALALLMLAAPSFMALQAWSWNRDQVGARADVKSLDSLAAGVFRGAAGRDAGYERELARRFREVFFDQQLSNDAVSREFNEYSYSVRESFTDRYRLTTFGLFVAYIAWWVAFLPLLLRGEQRWTWGTVAAGMLVTAVAYVVLLYSSYRFAFEDRSLDLPSYTRYIHSIALPMILLALAPLLPGFRKPGHAPVLRLRAAAVPAGAALFTGALITLYSFEPPYLRALYEPNPQVPLRRDYEPIANAVRAAVNGAPVWVYVAGDQEQIIGRVLQFLLSPTPVAVERSSTFFDQNFDAVVGRWTGFEYVWIPVSLQPRTAQSFSQFAPGHPIGGFFRVRAGATAGQALEPVALFGNGGATGAAPP